MAEVARDVPASPEATEVRCQEKTRGGLCYEVILGEPEVKATPPKRTISPQNKNMSVQDIEEKLKAAEERRQQLESNKIAALSAKMLKIEEASRKKDEQTSLFITTTREALEQKMETHLGKREAYITDLKTKLKDHIENVEKTRLSIEQQTEEVKAAIEEKMKSASAQRDENIKKMLERLREHEEQVTKNREKELQKKLEAAKKYNERLLEVKQSIETVEDTRRSEKTMKIETKLTAAEQKREQELQKKLELIKKNEKRAETVRQNKANIVANQTASSG
ncbi:Stathmin family [Popillia japonica]|uniref:Stathmin family n=1 Tax=Popillia japonica TaxID=7064 RepID=A0AAW1L927_POPJA